MTRDERIEANLDLCRYHATWIYRRIRRRIPLDDLIQAGMLGLVKASDRFDDSQGVRFRTFADRFVKGSILDLIRTETKSRKASQPALRFCSLEELKSAGFQMREESAAPDIQADLTRVWKLLRRLPKRTQTIIRLHYGNDLSLGQIGKLLGLTRGRIHQIRCGALKELRRSILIGRAA